MHKVSGRLPPEPIQRIIRMNFGRFRGCYQAALLERPYVQGRAELRFVIERDGTVSRSSVNGLRHAPELAKCLALKMYGIAFPQPEGGVVTVSYPLRLRPAVKRLPPQKFGYR